MGKRNGGDESSPLIKVPCALIVRRARAIIIIMIGYYYISLY